MKNGIIINGVKHKLVPTSKTVKGSEECKMCSLGKICNNGICTIFENEPNSHFELETE